MPRNAGVSGRSTTRFIFFKPSARTITLCFSGVHIGLPINLILIVPAILAYLFETDAAHVGGRLTIAELFERVDGGFHDVVRIMRADRLG